MNGTGRYYKLRFDLSMLRMNILNARRKAEKEQAIDALTEWCCTNGAEYRRLKNCKSEVA